MPAQAPRSARAPGLIGGTAIGADNARRAASDVERTYADAYYACMGEADNGPDDADYAYGPPPPGAYGPPPPAIMVRRRRPIITAMDLILIPITPITGPALRSASASAAAISAMAAAGTVTS